MAKHKESSVWGLRWPPSKSPNGVVRTMGKTKIGISISDNPIFSKEIIMDRKTARLLAKRINQCLDSTK